MTNEKMYEIVCAMLHEYDAVSDGRMSAARQVIDDPNYWSTTKLFPFYAHAADLLLEAKAGMDRERMPKSTLPALRKIVKNCTASPNTSLHGIFEQNGRYCLCDGYRAVRLPYDVESLPHVDAARAVNLETVWPKDAKIPLPLPTIAELKTFIAQDKAKHGRRGASSAYCIDDKVFADPEYLIEMMQALPGCTAYYDGTYTHPLRFEAPDGGDGILMPVRPSEEWRAAHEETA